MSREIKFRAWDSEAKTMLGADELDKTSIGHLRRASEDIGWELMQYTGLKDKNGKEIYEGDMVKGGAGISKVEFKSGCFGCMIKVDMLGMVWETFDSVNLSIEICEVIGNIYENPELLKEEEDE